MTPATTAHDLALAPFKPSRVLSEFKASRERERRERQADQETARAMAEFRRHGRSMPNRTAIRQAVADLPAPAFAVVDGKPAFGAVAGRSERGFDAASTGRLTAGWGTVNTSINADLEGALASLRSRSRGWAMNTDTGARFIDLVCDNVVGAAPPRLQVRAKLTAGDALDEVANTAIEEAWAQWCESGTCEVTGQLSFGEVCRAVVAATARDGEFLVRRVRDRKRYLHGFALQLLDVDRIDSARNQAPAVRGGPAVRMGVEIDALGRKTALYLTTAHPGDSGSGLAPNTISDRVEASNLLHGFVLSRPEQVRGFPWSAPILQRANTLNTYEQYAVIAAKIGAAKMGFYVTDKDAFDGAAMNLEQLRDANDELVQDVEPGMFEALPPGVSFESFNPDYPHQNYGAFVTDSKRSLAAGLNVAHHNLSGDMNGVNYSSARIAELSERRHWRAHQQWFINAFVKPVFKDWLTMALLTGSIQLPSGATLPADRVEKFASAAVFQPPSWAWVDPEADVKAAVEAMSNDMRSGRQVADENGVDLEHVLSDNSQQFKQYQKLGLPVPAWLARMDAQPKPATPAPAQPQGAAA